MNDARAITGSLVDVRNVNTHKCVRLIIDVPAENALKVISAFGWATMVNPVPVAVARLQGPRPQEGFVGDDIAHDLAEIPLSGGKCSKGTGAAGVEGSIPSRSTKSWDEILPSQQAGILCSDHKFWKFVSERDDCIKYIESTEDCATWVRQYCGINSRANITRNHPCWTKWRELVVDYRLWERAVV